MRRLGQQARVTLRLEQRVPEGFSAAGHEHRWHRSTMPRVEEVDVTHETLAGALAAAEEVLALAHDRRDYEFRVVTETVLTTRFVVIERPATPVEDRR